MGSCAGKSPKETTRRRLTVSSVETGECEAEAQVNLDDNDWDRSLLSQLNSQQLMALLASGQAQAASRKFSIGSVTDKALHRISSFTSKATHSDGDCVDGENLRIGFACKKGLKPEAPNQDSFLIVQVEGYYSIYGVFDGHGRKGHDVSNFVKENLPKILVWREDILTDPMLALKQAFDTTQRLIEQATSMQRIDAQRSGTTASVIVHDHKSRMLYLAHVGDSRCVLAKKDDSAGDAENQWAAVDLTEDHKPNLPAEKARIERGGGRVVFDGGYNYRVYAKGKRYPGLNMSRAMGDLKGFHDAGISAEPDIAQWTIVGDNEQDLDLPGASPIPMKRQSVSEASETGRSATLPSEVDHDLQSVASIRSTPSCAASVNSHEIDPIRDKFLLVCSDGVWEFLSSIEAVLAVAPFREQQAMEAAEYLASVAWDRWMHFMRGEVVDDITVIIVHIGAPSMLIKDHKPPDQMPPDTSEAGKSAIV